MPPGRRQEPRRLPLRPLLVALAGAVGVAAALVAASLIGSSTGAADPSVTAAAAAPAARDPLLRGIPQDGIALGSPKAPVTLVEYADLQCPYCAQWSRDTFPAIVDEYVRSGRVRVVLRGLSFIGPDSETALRAALAAGEQDRFWDVVHGLFRRQGAENSGWVTEDVLRGFDGGVVDAERMLAGTQSAWVERQLTAARTAATLAQVPGTPFFQAGPTGGALLPLDVGSLEPEAFRRELDRLLAA